MKQLTTKDGKYIYRVSRWIKINQSYNVTKRHSLYDYCTDENGYQPGSSSFNPTNGTYLDYFTWNGRKYAINQFLRLDFPIMWEENNKLNYLSGYDCENYYNPIMIELDDCCEYVRVYTE